jgi:hypothetical protein
LQNHSGAQLKRREPGIQQLARKYNKLCNELAAMIQQNQAPRGAVAPHLIEKDDLFNVEVDDDIWQDVGLNDIEDNMEDSIPLWLGDDDVRQGIRHLLERDRCEEEERRLCKERQAMHDWMVEEWTCVMEAIKCSGKAYLISDCIG